MDLANLAKRKSCLATWAQSGLGIAAPWRLAFSTVLRADSAAQLSYLHDYAYYMILVHYTSY